MAKEKYVELCRKVYELVKRGDTDGERKAAEGRLHQLMSKYGIELHEIESEERMRFWVKCTKDEREFFTQVVASVTMGRWGLGYCTGQASVEVEISIGLEIVARWEFFRDRLKIHMKAAYKAFIQVNKLYRVRIEKDDDEEFMKMRDDRRTKAEKDADLKAAQMGVFLEPEKFRKTLGTGK